MAKKVLKRDEIEKKYTWALEDIYSSVDEWEKEYAEVGSLCEKMKSYEGRVCESAKTLLEVLQLNDKMGYLFERILCYAHQLYDQDTANAQSQALSGRAGTLAVKMGESYSFINPEIMAAPEGTVEGFVTECDELKLYTKELEYVLRTKEHTLSADKEALLASVNDVLSAPQKTFSMFNNADVKLGKIKDENGDEVAVTHGRYTSFLESTDRRVREDAFNAMYSTFKGFENTIAANYEGMIKGDIFTAKARNFDTCIESYLFDGNVPVSVYENLIEAVHDALPQMYRYVKLRKKVLGLDELHMYDVYAPMVSDFKMDIPYEQAKEMVKEGVAALGEDYIKILQEGFDNRWIDVYENEGKRSGAYSWGPKGTHPYVLLNHQDNLDSAFTLAHEMGHAIHSYKSYAAQPYVYAGYRIFVAEVASTCNEALLNFHLIENAKDDKEKAYHINHFLERFRATVFRQTMFAEFEKKAHEMAEAGQTLTAAALDDIYYKLNELYFGPDMCVDKNIEIEWARIPHFYTPYYVYQYATGFSAAMAIAQMIREEGQPAVDRYMKFLSSGGSDYPIELLKIAGVDMSKPDAVKKGLKVFEELLDEMEKLIGCK